MNKYDDYLSFGPDYDYGDCEIDFANPGNNSALRAASKSNPRNFPCPTCEEPNKLTPADVALGYQCDSCADRMEVHYHIQFDVQEYPTLRERLIMACYYRLPWAFAETVKWFLTRKGWFCEPWF